MRIFYFLISVTMMLSTAFAENVKSNTAEKEKSIAAIKSEIKKEKNPTKNFYLLSQLVRKYASEKLTAGIVKDAKESADSLLAVSGQFKDDWNYGNAVHHSNLVLGRLDLLNGKTEDAKKHLKLAAQTPGSPQLKTFGPNMTLAKELLEKSEKTAVLEYFEDCLEFWKSKFARQEIDEWKIAIANGKIPEFNGHLVY